MTIHWDSFIFWEGRPWFLVTVDVTEMPKKIADLLIQIENDLSLELTLPAWLAWGEPQVIWPTGDKSTVKLIDLIQGAL